MNTQERIDKHMEVLAEKLSQYRGRELSDIAALGMAGHDAQQEVPLNGDEIKEVRARLVAMQGNRITR